MTRNVAQNIRPSFRFSGEGSGDETRQRPGQDRQQPCLNKATIVCAVTSHLTVDTDLHYATAHRFFTSTGQSG